MSKNTQNRPQKGIEQSGLCPGGAWLGSSRGHPQFWDDALPFWSLAAGPSRAPFPCSFKQQNLEQRQADVEYELRCLLNKPGKAAPRLLLPPLLPLGLHLWDPRSSELLQPCNCLSFLGVWLGREGLDRGGPGEGAGADAGAGDHHRAEERHRQLPGRGPAEVRSEAGWGRGEEWVFLTQPHKIPL